MQKDHLLTRRRALLAGAVSLGAAGVAAAFVPGAGNSAAPPAPAAGARAARRPLRPSEYRLRPLTGYGPPHTPRGRTPVRREPLLRVPGHGRTMVLSFDDGPDPRYTPHILDTLARYEVRAMFFVCGEMAAHNRDLLARMADEGHVVGNHTWSHPLLTRLRRARIRSEMERTSDIVEQAYGERPEWFRAPYGAWNRAAFQLGAAVGVGPRAGWGGTHDGSAPAPRPHVERGVVG
ncbi:polysaccharide deacetylase family protein, partial [Streptomyces sp. NPDC005009]